MSESNPSSSTPAPANPISPLVALQLRIRWLEALVLGLRPTGVSSAPAGPQQPLARRALDAQARLDSIVASNDSLRHFMNHYDEYAHLLTPAFALSPPASQQPDAGALDALLVEMEQDIRAADRDLREIDELEKGGATGAGKLIEHEQLQPRLRALVQAHEEDMQLAAKLEERIAVLLRRYATEVDALSELFVSWNGAINEFESRVGHMEKDKAERQRLGLA
ncbi:hypothetical protein EXIGLDRAFT_734026 [Exidia glandulosa HHB12029]|uniref:Uncharacterized protein n=1 Tax=Exidia glandulosa HHB12029 TaxID=1314781 RepID=A0A165B5Y8_EXIGL|nr:hypothetical protein EXIGLDRAFT_734026 [Exidia glandulosa HHB12029]